MRWRNGVTLMRGLPLSAGLVAVAVGMGASVSSAAASNPCGPGGSYSATGSTVTCTYKSASNSGATGKFVVPAGISRIHVTAVGGKGGDVPGGKDFLGITHPSRTGGYGAVLSTELPVAPGKALYVYVAGNGGNAQASGAVAPGGANGGGDTGLVTGAGGGAGGGGGASDVRTVAAPTSGAQTASLDSRLLVAGGGGGSADASDSGSPGNGNGGNAGQAAPDGFGGTPAQPGTANANGTGSGGAGGTSGSPGQNGSQGVGGAGGSDCCYQGGGGGGGLYGGGGGGSLYGQPGAGGASWVEQVASRSSTSTDTTGVPLIKISYSLRSTSTSVACSPSRVASKSPTRCTATVKDTAKGSKSTPTGKVSFASNGKGRFVRGSCTLKRAKKRGTASCSVIYRPSAKSGKQTITATYRANAGHRASRGKTTLHVSAAAPVRFTG